MTRCVDLVERFGARYRIGYEPQKREWPRIDWPWIARVRCRRGWIGVAGGTDLQAFTARRILGRRLRALPFVTAARGDVETVIRFPVEHTDAVFAILMPLRRPQLTDEQRAARREGLLAQKKAGFLTPGSTQASQDGETGQPGSRGAK